MVIPNDVLEFVRGVLKQQGVAVLYGYSVFNLTKNKLTHRVYWTTDRKLWVKTDAEGNVTEAYKEYDLETATGLVSTSLDLLTLEPLEAYRKDFRLGLSCRVKYDLQTGAELATDYFGTINELLKVMPIWAYEMAKALPYQLVTYFGSKPYGLVVGVIEEDAVA